ncbi:MAG TPA: MarC family protein [Candidatus Hydrogenedentes bacterium]|nr:MarC family protein [Candidatus Hydrogenedentota bacterium]
MLLHDALVLFAMVNAVGNLPIFADLTSHMDSRTKKQTYDTAVFTACGIVVVFAFLGHWMLQSVFQVSTDSFKVAGGLMVFFVAARGMILGTAKSHFVSSEPHDNIGIFPMGFPFLAGPGTIVTTILLMQEGGAYVTALAAILVYIAVLPVLYLTSILHLVFGRVGTLVISRILYIFIAAKAVDFVLTGLRASL